MRILLADDDATVHLIAEDLLETVDHTLTHAYNGQEAVDLFRTQKIDLILMDIQMPDMDGITAIREIRANKQKRHIPIIVVSGVIDSMILSQCMEVGADGILQKPFDAYLLNAKVKAHQRIQFLTDALTEQTSHLEESQRKTTADLQLARTVLAKASQACSNFPPFVQWRTQPCEDFNGDLVLGMPSPTGGFYLLLADFTGHGLPAALGALPTSQLFYAMCQQNEPINKIATEINTCLYRYLPIDMYAAAVIAESNSDGSKITYWHGGFPDLLVFENHRVVAQHGSKHMALGVLDTDEFDSTTSVITLQPKQRLLIFTDGLIELENINQRPFGYEGIQSAIFPHSQKWVRDIFDAANGFAETNVPQDDISVLAIECQATHPITWPAEPQPYGIAQEPYTPWRLIFTIDAAQMRAETVLPRITNILQGFPELITRLPELSCVLAEIYNNSLDHGLLGLTSEVKAIKQEAEPELGFLTYYQRRREKLAALTQASITIEMNTALEDGILVLNIRLTDSSEGFDHEKICQTLTQISHENSVNKTAEDHIRDRGDTESNPDDDNALCIGASNDDRAYYRGLLLVKALCSDVTFMDEGRTTVLTFHP
jgi:CheY-like chemotaxis protein